MPPFLFFSFLSLSTFPGADLVPPRFRNGFSRFLLGAPKRKLGPRTIPVRGSPFFFVCLENGWHGALDLGEIRK
jgi:hypothetical protein